MRQSQAMTTFEFISFIKYRFINISRMPSIWMDTCHHCSWSPTVSPISMNEEPKCRPLLPYQLVLSIYCESILFRGAEISSFKDYGHIRGYLTSWIALPTKLKKYKTITLNFWQMRNWDLTLKQGQFRNYGLASSSSLQHIFSLDISSIYISTISTSNISEKVRSFPVGFGPLTLRFAALHSSD